MNNTNTLIQHLLTWVDTGTWADSYVYLKRHPEMINNLSEQILHTMQSQARSEAEAKVLANHLTLLSACGREGIDFAYKRLVNYNPQSTPSIDRLVEALQSLNRLPDTARQRVTICRMALQQITKESDTIIWGAFQSEYGLALIQYLDSDTDRESQMEDAINALQASLSVFTLQTNAAEWANVQTNLANAHLLRIAGDSRQNFQQAVIYARDALGVLTKPQQYIPADQLPTLKPYLELIRHFAQRHLGVALLETEQYTEAINALQPGLTFFNQQEHLTQWLEIRYRLGDAHYHCPEGNRVDHVHKAIAYFEEVLPHFDPNQFSTQWVKSHHLLGLAYAGLHLGIRTQNVEKAISHLETAVSHYDPTQNHDNWASANADLGLLYSERYTGNRSQNIEDAIKHLELGLSVLTLDEFPDNWYKITNNLGTAYLNRIAGNRRDNVEKSIQYFQQALQSVRLPQQRIHWAILKSHLAYAYVERIAGENADNIEQAIAYSKEASQYLNRETTPREWASNHNNASLAWGRRVLGDPETNIRESMHHSEQALEIYTRDVDAVRWAQNKLNLGYMYRELYQHTGNLLELEYAIAETEEAIGVYPLQEYPERWAMAATNLAMMLVDRQLGSKSDNLHRAIELLQEVLKIYTRSTYPERWARTHLNLGVVYAELVEAGGVASFSHAVTHFTNAISVLNENYPHEYQLLARNLGNTYMQQESWSEAVKWYERYVTISRVLFDTAYSEGGRLTAATAVSEIYGQYAYAYIQMGQYDLALEVAEAGKAQLLSDALNQTDFLLTKLPTAQQKTIKEAQQRVQTWEVHLHTAESASPEERQALADARYKLKSVLDTARNDHPDMFPKPLSATTIRQLVPLHSAILMPLLTTYGSYLFFIPHSQEEILAEYVVSLPFDRQTLLNPWMLGDDDTPGWLTAYENKLTDTESWLQTIEVITSELWDTFFEPIAHLLEYHQVRQLILIPQGGLQLLPIHAAWRWHKNEKRYLLDDLVVQMVPSCQAFAQANHRRTSIDVNVTLLAVANPTGDLPFADQEIESIATLFDRVQTLRQKEAQLKTLLMVESPQIFHFAGHGVYDWSDVQQSGLVCADAVLTLHTMQRRLPLDKTQLVVLSACETGLVDVTHSPDEYIGLPLAFLSAGVAGVVSSLWAVNDLSTMLLMERFYQLLSRGKDSVSALCQAQIWLRDVTAQELANRFGEEHVNLKNNRLTVREATNYWRRFAALEPEDKPFSHPYYWAAFTFTGA